MTTTKIIISYQQWFRTRTNKQIILTTSFVFCFVMTIKFIFYMTSETRLDIFHQNSSAIFSSLAHIIITERMNNSKNALWCFCSALQFELSLIEIRSVNLSFLNFLRFRPWIPRFHAKPLPVSYEFRLWTLRDERIQDSNDFQLSCESCKVMRSIKLLFSNGFLQKFTQDYC